MGVDPQRRWASGSVFAARRAWWLSPTVPEKFQAPLRARSHKRSRYGAFSATPMPVTLARLNFAASHDIDIPMKPQTAAIKRLISQPY